LAIEKAQDLRLEEEREHELTLGDYLDSVAKLSQTQHSLESNQPIFDDIVLAVASRLDFGSILLRRRCLQEQQTSPALCVV